MYELLTTLKVYNCIFLFDNILFLVAMSNTIIPVLFMDQLRILVNHSRREMLIHRNIHDRAWTLLFNSLRPSDAYMRQ